MRFFLSRILALALIPALLADSAFAVLPARMPVPLLANVSYPCASQALVPESVMGFLHGRFVETKAGFEYLQAMGSQNGVLAMRPDSGTAILRFTRERGWSDGLAAALTGLWESFLCGTLATGIPLCLFSFSVGAFGFAGVLIAIGVSALLGHSTFYMPHTQGKLYFWQGSQLIQPTLSPQKRRQALAKIARLGKIFRATFIAGFLLVYGLTDHFFLALFWATTAEALVHITVDLSTSGPLPMMPKSRGSQKSDDPLRVMPRTPSEAFKALLERALEDDRVFRPVLWQLTQARIRKFLNRAPQVSEYLNGTEPVTEDILRVYESMIYEEYGIKAPARPTFLTWYEKQDVAAAAQTVLRQAQEAVSNPIGLDRKAKRLRRSLEKLQPAILAVNQKNAAEYEASGLSSLSELPNIGSLRGGRRGKENFNHLIDHINRVAEVTARAASAPMEAPAALLPVPEKYVPEGKLQMPAGIETLATTELSALLGIPRTTLLRRLVEFEGVQWGMPGEERFPYILKTDLPKLKAYLNQFGLVKEIPKREKLEGPKQMVRRLLSSLREKGIHITHDGLLRLLSQGEQGQGRQWADLVVEAGTLPRLYYLKANSDALLDKIILYLSTHPQEHVDLEPKRHLPLRSVRPLEQAA